MLCGQRQYERILLFLNGKGKLRRRKAEMLGLAEQQHRNRRTAGLRFHPIAEINGLSLRFLREPGRTVHRPGGRNAQRLCVHRLLPLQQNRILRTAQLPVHGALLYA